MSISAGQLRLCRLHLLHACGAPTGDLVKGVSLAGTFFVSLFVLVNPMRFNRSCLATIFFLAAELVRLRAACKIPLSLAGAGGGGGATITSTEPTVSQHE